jgi:hypothetical protein
LPRGHNAYFLSEGWGVELDVYCEKGGDFHWRDLEKIVASMKITEVKK